MVAEILDTGKTLRTVYVTHDHPDHFFSMEVVTNAFPDAQVISAPVVVEDIWRSIPLKLKRWGPMLGPNGPRYPTAPQAWTQDAFELEGHRIEILGPMGVSREHLLEKWFRDVRITDIYEGTGEIQRMIIARTLLGYSRDELN